MTFRLAYLTSQYPAASHTFIRREVEALRESGWTVDTFSIRPPAPGEADAERDAAEARQTFTILRQPALAFLCAHAKALVSAPGAYFRTLGLALRHRAPGAKGVFLGLAHFAESVLLARELKRRGAGHLHNHFANSAATVGLLASRLAGIGWSFTMHGISETDYPAGLMLGRKIEAADMVACASWYMRAQGLRLVSADQWQKLHVVRCGIAFDRLPVQASHNGAPVILCVGRLSPEKGQAGLLEAFAKLRATHGDARLRLVGDGPDRRSLEAKARELGIAEAVTFTGRLSEDETLAEIARADILALSSFMEGLPVVLMEAMAIGVPVVASRVAGIPELVEDGATGLLFTASRWDELADCLKRLIDDQALRGELVARAKERVASEFDVRNSARVIGGLFEALRAAE